MLISSGVCKLRARPRIHSGIKQCWITDYRNDTWMIIGQDEKKMCRITKHVCSALVNEYIQDYWIRWLVITEYSCAGLLSAFRIELPATTGHYPLLRNKVDGLLIVQQSGRGFITDSETSSGPRPQWRPRSRLTMIHAGNLLLRNCGGRCRRCCCCWRVGACNLRLLAMRWAGGGSSITSYFSSRCLAGRQGEISVLSTVWITVLALMLGHCVRPCFQFVGFHGGKSAFVLLKLISQSCFFLLILFFSLLFSQPLCFLAASQTMFLSF